MRFNPTDRIGVNETERIVTKNLGWIFREQSIADVGLDAIIEQVENGDPTGKFIAIQIKTGEGNFYRTEKGLTLYVTNIHYNYWLNLSIPIILVAHLPKENETFWQEINEFNFKKSKKRWKIEIPFKQKFNENCLNKLSKIVSKKNDKKFDVYRGSVVSNDLNEIIEDLETIKDATECMNNITLIMNNQTEETNRITSELNKLIDKGMNNNNSEVKSLYKTLGKSINLTARRSETEIELFSQLYSIGIYAFEKLVNNLIILNVKFEDLGTDVEALKKVPGQIDFATNNFLFLRETVSDLKTSYPILKEARVQYLEVLDLMINEFKEASQITKHIFAKIT